MSASRLASLPRSKTLTGKPPSNEERVVAALERSFPGSEWLESPSASTLPGESESQSHRGSSPTPDTLSQEGTGTLDFVVIVGSDYDPRRVVAWANKVDKRARVLCGSPRVAPKAGTPMNGEAVLFEHRPQTIEVQWGEDFLGKGFRNLQIGLLVTEAVRYGATIVVIGRGKRVELVETALEHWGKYAPPVQRH